MMKKWLLSMAIVVLACGSWAACSPDDGFDKTFGDETEHAPDSGDDPQTPDGETPNPDDESMKLNVAVGGRMFSATLEASAAARAFAGMLPLRLQMTELNGNEKYAGLPQSLPTDTYRPGTIRTGDLMLWGSNTLVLFYETFSTSYSYTRLGRIDDPEGLADAVGSGSVEVTFERQGSVARFRGAGRSPDRCMKRRER